VLAGYGDAMRETAAGEVRGELRVTAPLVFGRRHVTPIVASFLEAYPDTRVELVLNDRSLNFIEEGLDLAVRIGRLADSSLVARRVGEVRRLWSRAPRISPDEEHPGSRRIWRRTTSSSPPDPRARWNGGSTAPGGKSRCAPRRG